MNFGTYLKLLLGSMTMAIFTTTAYTEELATNFVFEPLIHAEPINLNDFKGRVILIVNTASKCGFTGQYEGLEKLHQDYHEQGLVIICVPSNDFGYQEPGSNKSISDFCKINYGVSFPMTSKYSVRGKDAHPFYKWARRKFGFAGAPKWNFHKYLINRRGELVNFFHSTTQPTSYRLIKAIEDSLN